MSLSSPLQHSVKMLPLQGAGLGHLEPIATSQNSLQRPSTCKYYAECCTDL